MISKPVLRDLESAADSKKAAELQRFFKTGPGEYGEGDRFRGIVVPVLRKLSRQHGGQSLDSCEELLHSSWHEDRLLALLILVRKFGKADESGQNAICRLYLANTAWINNWDLVDLSAPGIPGAWFLDRRKTPMLRLARSSRLWERRIAMVGSHAWIRQGRFDDALAIATILLHDPHDLIHKAVGWMLREIGKRDPSVEESFLRRHYLTMPRTALRYAIERFPEEQRLAWLHGKAFSKRVLETMVI